MTDDIVWMPSKEEHIRGSVLDTDCRFNDIAELSAVLPAIWRTAYDMFRRYPDGGQPKLAEIEVWPDTGRIIFILKRRREIARLVVNISLLEQMYFALPTEVSEFNKAYAELLDRILRMLHDSVERDGANHTNCEELAVIARDSDNQETNVYFAG
jgi:hypothetical protein